MPFSCQSIFVTLACNEFDTLVTFYRDLFDQLPQPYKHQSYAEFQLPGLRLGIFKPQSDHRKVFSGKSSGSMSLCLEVANLDIAIVTLAKLGYPPPGNVIKAAHGREIYAYDPEGNRLILYQK
jgi:predicted enzyme related to lactoylglutathione lyase